MHISDRVDFGLQKGAQRCPVGLQILHAHIHVLNLVVLNLRKVILSHLFVDLENFFQLRTVTLCLFAQTDALQTEIVIHLARVHVFFETTTGQASLLAALTAVLIGTSHVLALQSPLPNPVPHLDVNEFGAA